MAFFPEVNVAFPCGSSLPPPSGTAKNTEEGSEPYRSPPGAAKHYCSVTLTELVTQANWPFA